MRALTFALLAIALLATPLLAAPYSDFYVIPVAGHISGANGSLWKSDVALQNFQSTPLTIELLYIATGQPSVDNVANLVSTAVPTGSVTVTAGGSVLLQDVLDHFDGHTDGLLGALIVTAEKPFAVTSRAYTTNASGGTIGQTVPPVQDFIENTLGDTDLATAVAYVPGLISSSAYRTNLGFVAGAGDTALQLTVTLRGASGAILGARGFTIAPNTLTHVQFPAGSIAAGAFDTGSAEFRITAGDGAVAPYASVVDNRTSSASFINGVFPPSTPFGPASFGSGSVLRRLVARRLLPH